MSKKSGGGNGSEPKMTPKKLEAVLRHYPEFRELYEREGVEEITLEGGFVVNIHDILDGIDRLPLRQRQALILTTLMGLREADVARLMGLKKWSNPVGTYKHLALKKLIEWKWS